MSRASEYRKKVQESRTSLPVEQVLLPSGDTWGLRRPDLQAWVVTGRLPQSLLEEGMKAWRELKIVKGDVPDAEKLMAGMSDKDVLDSMIFMREIVREACVDPRIGSGEDEIEPSEIDPDDFMFIFSWATGAGLDGLRTFRTRQERGGSGNSSMRKKQRSKSIKPPKSEPVLR